MVFEQFASEINQVGGIIPGDNFNPTLRSTQATRYRPIYASYTAHMCCADSSRLREIVFTSDLSVKSEAQAGTNYKRFLCDYSILNPTTFSYDITHTRDQDPYLSTNNFIARKASVSEVLPSHRYYASENASAGRWQELRSPEPLHEIEVRAMCKVWSYSKNDYELIDIPLPAGMQYSVKLIFVSKENQAVAIVDKPDRYHT